MKSSHSPPTPPPPLARLGVGRAQGSLQDRSLFWIHATLTENCLQNLEQNPRLPVPGLLLAPSLCTWVSQVHSQIKSSNSLLRGPPASTCTCVYRWVGRNKVAESFSASSSPPALGGGAGLAQLSPHVSHDHCPIKQGSPSLWSEELLKLLL